MNEKIMQLVEEIEHKMEELKHHLKQSGMNQRGGYYGGFPGGGMNFRDGQGGGSGNSGGGGSYNQRGGGQGWDNYPPGFDPRYM